MFLEDVRAKIQNDLHLKSYFFSNKRLACVFLFLLFQLNCTNKNSDFFVIERSRKTLPPWTQSLQDKMIKKEKIYTLVKLRQQLYDLQLGLHQTKLWALEGARMTLIKSLLEKIESHIPNEVQKKKYSNLLSKKISSKNLPFLVEDIYFEKYHPEKSSEIRSRIYVKMSAETQKMNSLVLKVGIELAGNSDRNSRNLSEILLQNQAWF